MHTTDMLEDARALCAEFEIEIVGKSRYPEPGQTRAIVSIARIIRRHGQAHARMMLTVLTECKGNNALIDEMSLNAVSTLVLACSDMIEEDASAFLDLFDKIPFGLLMAMANELRGIVHQGHALAGMLYLVARRSASLTGQEATRCVQTAARISEAAKGRQMSSRAPTLRPGEDRAWPMALGDESQTPSRTFRVVAKGKLRSHPGHG